MKILHIVCGLAPDVGGPGIIAASLASAQARLGHDVILFGNYDRAQESSVKNTFSQFPGSELVRIVNTGNSGVFEHLVPFRGWKLLYPLIDKSSVIHLHGMWDPLLHLAYLLARRHNARYVMMPHSMLHPWEMQRYWFFKRVWIAFEIRTMLTNATFVHAGTNSEVDFIRHISPNAKFRVIPNGIFPEQVATLPRAGEFRLKHPTLQHNPYVLFLSRLHHQKGLNFLIEAFEILTQHNDQIQLVVAGPDRGEQEKFCQVVARKGLSSRVHLVGPLYGREKMAAFRDALCFCLPSLNEGFSMALLEALACGIPAVISENCFFPEVAEAHAGFVVPLDANRIAAALQALISDPIMQKRMGLNARQLVAQHYTWDALAKRTLDAYSNSKMEEIYEATN